MINLFAFSLDEFVPERKREKERNRKKLDYINTIEI